MNPAIAHDLQVAVEPALPRLPPPGVVLSIPKMWANGSDWSGVIGAAKRLCRGDLCPSGAHHQNPFQSQKHLPSRKSCQSTWHPVSLSRVENAHTNTESRPAFNLSPANVCPRGCILPRILRPPSFRTDLCPPTAKARDCTADRFPSHHAPSTRHPVSHAATALTPHAHRGGRSNV